MSINQYPEWIKCNELNAIQSQEIIDLKERIKMKDTVAFIYIHKTNGVIRVESLETAKNIDGNPDWNHVSTVNALVSLEMILRATGEERELIIKHLLT